MCSIISLAQNCSSLPSFLFFLRSLSFLTHSFQTTSTVGALQFSYIQLGDGFHVQLRGRHWLSNSTTRYGAVWPGARCSRPCVNVIALGGKSLRPCYSSVFCMVL